MFPATGNGSSAILRNPYILGCAMQPLSAEAGILLGEVGHRGPSTRVGNTRLLLPTVKGPQGWRVTFPRMRRNLPKTWRLKIALIGSFPTCGLAEGAQLTFQKTEVRVGWAPFSSGRIHVHMPQIVGRIHSLADAEVMEAGRFRTHRRASL